LCNVPVNPTFDGTQWTVDYNSLVYGGRDPHVESNDGTDITKAHFGIVSAINPTDCVLEDATWYFPDGTSQPESVVFLDITVNECQSNNVDFGASKTKYRYALVFLAASFKPSGPATFGEWYFVPYTPNGSQQPTLTFTNGGRKPIYVSSSGIILNLRVPKDPDCQTDLLCSDNISLLHAENATDYPPPGSPHSKFKPLDNPPTILYPQGALHRRSRSH
jgi:hypothetical protein